MLYVIFTVIFIATTWLNHTNNDNNNFIYIYNDVHMLEYCY